MKKTLMAIGALGAVLALVLTSMVLGVGSESNTEGQIEGNGPENEIDMNFFEAWPGSLDTDDEEKPTSSYNFFEAWPSNTDEETDETITEDEPDETSIRPVAPKFSNLVKRSYDHLTRDFISKYSHWDKLPAVKTIFTANSSGEWMYKALPRINATGEARIIDRDGDGYPELVIWKHYRRDLTATSDQANTTRNMMAQHTEDIDLSRISVYVNRGFTLVYVDMDGDAIPDRISLDVSEKLWVNLDNDIVPEFVHTFRWYGITIDRDDDGDQDVQRMNVSIKTVLNINHDRFPELMVFENVHYARMDLRGRPMWDLIHAKVNKGMTLDPNSDGNPIIKKDLTSHGYWMDKDGDTWPNLIRISRRSSYCQDKDSDGNPEERKITSVSVLFIDRNDDRYPELVLISFKDAKYIDRDSDGKVDVIEVHLKIFKWIDRNSDGIPERVTRTETYETIHPKNDNERPDIEPERKRPEEEEPRQRPEDDEEEDRNEGQKPELRPEDKKEEEREPEKKREMNGQLSSSP